MKIKFEVKLTASRELLAVLGSMFGLAVANKTSESEPPILKEPESMNLKGENVESITSGEPESANAGEPKQPTRTRRSSTPKVAAIPEKIVPPEPVKEEPETQETVATGEGDGPGPVQSDLTVDDIRNLAGQLIQSKPALRDRVFAILKNHGAEKISEVKPEHFEAVIEELKQLS